MQVPRVAQNVGGGQPMAYTPVLVPQQGQQQQPPPPAQMSEEDVEEFSKMFPDLDKQVIKVRLSRFIDINNFEKRPKVGDLIYEIMRYMRIFLIELIPLLTILLPNLISHENL